MSSFYLITRLILSDDSFAGWFFLRVFMFPRQYTFAFMMMPSLSVNMFRLFLSIQSSRCLSTRCRCLASRSRCTLLFFQVLVNGLIPTCQAFTLPIFLFFLLHLYKQGKG